MTYGRKQGLSNTKDFILFPVYPYLIMSKELFYKKHCRERYYINNLAQLFFSFSLVWNANSELADEYRDCDKKPTQQICHSVFYALQINACGY